MESPATETGLKVPMAEAAPVLKTLAAKNRKIGQRIDHRSFVRVLNDFMRRDPEKRYHPSELQQHMMAQFKSGVWGVHNHIAKMVKSRSLLTKGASRSIRYYLPAAVAAYKPVREVTVTSAHKAKAKAVKHGSVKAKPVAVASIDSDEQLLNQFLAVLVQMEGWAQRQKKRDAHYRKLLTLLKEVE